MTTNDEGNVLTDGTATLSAVDFLGLAEEKKVALIDLGRIGYDGIIFVTDMDTATRTKVMGRMTGKTRLHKDQSIDLNWSQMPQDAPQKMVQYCMVTDDNDGQTLLALFKEAQAEAEADGREWPDKWPTIRVHSDQVTTVWDQMVKALKKPALVKEKLGAMPHAVLNEVAGCVRSISGLTDQDDYDEKKDD